MIFSRGLTIWKSNIAMEHGQFTDDLPIKMVIVHSYVSLPKGMNPSANFACLHMSTYVYSRKYHHQTLNIEPEHRNIQQSIRPTLP